MLEVSEKERRGLKTSGLTPSEVLKTPLWFSGGTGRRTYYLQA